MLFSHFKLCQPANFEPVYLRKVYIHHLKALKEERLTQYENGGRGPTHMADPVQ